MVNTTKLSIQIRPMLLTDLNEIFSIDEKIRSRLVGESVTYEDISAKQIFGVDESKEDSEEISNIAEAVELISFGFVAEVDGHICGFILGRRSSIGDVTSEFGEVAFLGVLPDYWHKGIARKLLDSLCENFRSSGINTVAIGVVRRDKALVAFFEHMGFSRGPLLSYVRAL